MSEHMNGNPEWPGEQLLESPDERSIPSLLAALAYEQRTANLIAWRRQQPLGPARKKLEVAIDRRLGRNDDRR